MDMDFKFDEILQDVWPYLIFPPKNFRNNIADKTKFLFLKMLERDSDLFNELSSQIKKMINDREIFDSNNENNIASFDTRRFSFNNILNEINNKMVSLTQRMINFEEGQKPKDKKLKIKNKLHKTKKKKPEKEKKVKTEKLTHPECPTCKIVMGKQGLTKDGRQRYRCPKPKNGCGRAFTEDNKGHIPKCKKCGNLKYEYRGKRYCTKCENK